MAKIVFCGAQNTGKTTVAELFAAKFPDHRLMSGFARNSPYAGTNLNKQSSPLNQLYLLTAIAAATNQPDIVSDRCPIDALAYTMWAMLEGSMLSGEYDMSKEDVEFVLRFTRRTMQNYDLVVYFPAYDWDIRADGVRDLDPEYRDEIGHLMSWYLTRFCPGHRVMPDVAPELRLTLLAEWVEEVRGGG